MTVDVTTPLSTGPRVSWGFVMLLVVGMIALQYARMPQVILDGRVWAEEGLFLSAARSRGAIDAMLWRAPVGYYNLQLNVAGLVASRLPLAWAPAVMTGLASLLLIIPILVVALDPTWRRWSRLVMLAACLLLVGPSEEVWLNVASGQFVLGVAAALMLVSESTARGSSVVRAVALGVFGLCGVASAMLAPLFIVRAILQRTRQRATEAAVLGAALAVQLTLVASAPPGPQRYHVDSLDTLGKIVVSRQIAQPLVYPLDHALPFSRTEVARRINECSGLILPAVALYAGLAWWTRRTGRHELIWLVASAAVMVGGAVAATFDPTATLVNPDIGVRYFFAPNVLLMLCAASCAIEARSRVGVVVVMLCLVVGVLDFVFVNPYFITPADWYARVKAHEADPTHVIRHAPVGWSLAP